MNDHLTDALRRSDSADFVRLAKKTPGYQPLVVVALKDAANGITSLEEVKRVAEQVDESPDYMDIPDANKA